MSLISTGDLSQSFQLRRDNGRLKADLQRLTQELSSGRIADLPKSLRGDLRPLTAIERSIALVTSYQTATAEAATFAESAQSALGEVAREANDLSGALLIHKTALLPFQLNVSASKAAEAFETQVARLNAQVAGRSIFGGIATNGPPLRSGEEILTELVTVTAGATTAADVEAALDTWFGPGGGYETFAYLGSTTSLAPMRLSDQDDVSFQATALSDEIRDSLKATAMSAVLDRGVLAGSESERRALAVRSGEALIGSADRLTALRSEIGVFEAQIDRARVRNASELSAAEAARAALVEADPFRVAAELQTVQTQIEALYAVTARVSRLSLVAYLR